MLTSDDDRPDLLTQLLDAGEQHARVILLEMRAPQLQAFYHLITPGRLSDTVIPCLWTNPREKEHTVAAVKAEARKIGAIAAMFLGEAWALKLPPGKLPRDLPRRAESPDRIEVVQIIVTDGKHTRQRIMQMIRDKPGGTLISLVTQQAGDEDNFVGLLIDDIIPVRRAS